MTNNVFGTAITEDPDRKRRASVAEERKYDGREKDAQTYLSKLKNEYGDGLSTECMIYNATGEPIRIMDQKDWHGLVRESYPQIIQNGQWGAFLHVLKCHNGGGSEAALLCRGTSNTANEHCDFIVAWDNRRGTDNHVYTEIHNIDVPTNWDDIRRRLENRSAVHSESFMGCWSSISIRQGDSTSFEALLTVE